MNQSLTPLHSKNKIVKITNLLVSVQLQGSCISVVYLDYIFVCKKPLHNIILNENYPMHSPMAC